MGPPTIPRAADVELLEAAVWANLHGQFAQDAGDHFAVVQRLGRAAVLASPATDAVAVNRAIGLGFEQPLHAAQLAELRDFYRRQGKARWFVECSPHAAIDLADLRTAGGVPGGSQVKLVAAVDAFGDLPSTHLEVVEALPVDRVAYMDLVGPTLGVPEHVRAGIVSTIGRTGWHFYFAIAENQAIAGAAMYIQQAGAWFGLAATLPTFRNRGAQSALLLRRLEDARSAGCQWVSAEAVPETTTPNPSLHNMKRLGMRELYHRPWYRFQNGTSRPSA